MPMAKDRDELPLFSTPMPELRTDRPSPKRPRTDTSLTAAIEAWGEALALAGRFVFDLWGGRYS